MPRPSRIFLRLTLAVLLTAVIPLITGVVIERSLVRNLSAQLYNPRVGRELERSLGVYQELAKALKAGMRYEAEAIAAREPLRATAALGDQSSVAEELEEIFPKYPNLVSLTVLTADGSVLAEKKRAKPLDPRKELTLEVYKPLGPQEDSPRLRAVFSTSKEKFDQLQHASETIRLYKQIESSFQEIENVHMKAFMGLLALTVLVAVFVGTLLSRGVTRRIQVLSKAANEVGRGDLSVRVPEEGNDEIARLSEAFNAMVEEVERSRARIEFLQRMGIWQEMARRLAHEIKNPLTPIQLAIEELGARYRGDDPAFQSLLDTTRTIISEEVETLRRLVTEFGAFARLPRAELRLADLTAFLEQERERIDLLGGEGADDALAGVEVTLSWELPAQPIEVYLDQHMMHRVLVNLVRNAAQAIRDGGQNTGRVLVSVRQVEGEWVEIVVDDDGPGIEKEMKQTIFDPYVTTKEDGTGLGLSIVKKIIMDHGGNIEPGTSQWGGARMTIRLPLSTNPAAEAARQQSEGPTDSQRSWSLGGKKPRKRSIETSPEADETSEHP